jgi:hypothetical protein
MYIPVRNKVPWYSQPVEQEHTARRVNVVLFTSEKNVTFLEI